MKESKFSVCIAILSLMLIYQFSLISATSYDSLAYEKTLSTSKIPSGTNADVIVSVLKYEPYPVIAGQWFDLWVKVQNIGEQSTKNLTIQLVPEYPFISDDNLSRNYGILFGTQSAYKVDQTYDATEIVLKYRLKTAENAPSKASNLKLRIILDSSNLQVTQKEFDLPIEIFSSSSIQASAQSAQVDNSQSIFYGLIGLVTGMFIVILLVLLKNKKKSHSN